MLPAKVAGAVGVVVPITIVKPFVERAGTIRYVEGRRIAGTLPEIRSSSRASVKAPMGRLLRMIG